jgi:glutathione S-transferase
MLKLYGVLRSRATRNYWLLNELGVPFEHIPVIQAYRLQKPDAAGAPINTRTPSFLAINGAGQIPVLVDGDLKLAESFAINLYLAKKHGGPLAPHSLTEEAKAMQWALWAATDIEPHAINILYHRVGKPLAERDEKIALAAIETLKPKFAMLDQHLASADGHMMGGRFTVVDINVAEVFRYAMPAPDLFDGAPSVKAWLAACQSRPYFKAMMVKREAEPA